ncbi:unnamed protein product, partial [Didymodactylos carnosus]
LNSGIIVPVALGYVKYNHYVPKSGYLDVRDYQSPKELAQKLLALDKNITAYKEFFAWRKFALHIKVPKYICELCLRLFVDDKTTILDRIDQYWNKKTQCKKYAILTNGRWIMS